MHFLYGFCILSVLTRHEVNLTNKNLDFLFILHNTLLTDLECMVHENGACNRSWSTKTQQAQRQKRTMSGISGMNSRIMKRLVNVLQ